VYVCWHNHHFIYVCVFNAANKAYDSSLQPRRCNQQSSKLYVHAWEPLHGVNNWHGTRCMEWRDHLYSAFLTIARVVLITQLGIRRSSSTNKRTNVCCYRVLSVTDYWWPDAHVASIQRQYGYETHGYGLTALRLLYFRSPFVILRKIYTHARTDARSYANPVALPDSECRRNGRG